MSDQNTLSPEKLLYGCMWLGGGWDANDYSQDDLNLAHAAIDAALEIGITRFDHADIYTLGKAEKVFGQVMQERPGLREQIKLQSKCGIRFDDELGPKRYDLSKAWIVSSVEGILSRLGIEQLDTLLLHRPDPLMQPDEIASAFDELQASGKVAEFGVSNMHHYQIATLKKSVAQPLVANQMEISLQQHAWLDEGIYAGHPAAAEISFSGGTFEYCNQENIEVQSWGSLCRGLYSGADISGQSEAVYHTAQLVMRLTEKYDVSAEAILLAWLFRHPANISAVIGSTNTGRIQACGAALSTELSREDWYALYVTARGEEIP